MITAVTLTDCIFFRGNIFFTFLIREIQILKPIRCFYRYLYFNQNMNIYKGNYSVVIYLIEYYRQYFISCEFWQIKCLTKELLYGGIYSRTCKNL